MQLSPQEHHEACPTKGSINKVPRGSKPLRAYNIANSINKFSKKYISFYSLFKVRGLETKTIT